MATMTAAHARTLARSEFNAFYESCPTRQVLSTVGDKWSALIVTALADGSRRHSELLRLIAGASQKMLTQTLRTLERDGLVARTITPTVPVRVDYELTTLGADLVPLVRALKNWSEEHIVDILEARARYEERGE